MGGWFLLVLFLLSGCATGAPRGGLLVGYRYHPLTPPPAPRESVASRVEPGVEWATVYEVEFLEPGAVRTRPVRINKAEFQRALLRLAGEVRLGRRKPREVAHELLSLMKKPEEAPLVESWGEWRLEQYGGQGFTFLPERQQGPIVLTPAVQEALVAEYLKWCGGGDCLGLLDDGPYLRTDDKRALALALSFGNVLPEAREALGRELPDERALVSMVVWTVALYCTLWLVPEPTTKAVAATLTVILMSWLGLQTMYGLVDGWARLADAAHHATTFKELRAAGEEFGKVLGEDAARALILGVATLSGHTLGQVVARVKTLPGYSLAGTQWEAQGGAAVLGRVEATEVALAQEGALAWAVAAVETVATSPQGPLAVVMLKKRQGGRTEAAPGGRTCETVLSHRGGNRQVILSDGQRWHLPWGKSVADIPAEDKVGDMLQEAVTRAASEWGPHRLSRNERDAIEEAEKKGEHWLARLLEHEARGRFVQERVKAQFEHIYDFSLSRGVDVVDPATGLRYEILSGTESNLARHGRRMGGEFFRMLTF
jgi:hypothetical protein